ncbi:MAG: AEC family transporter [Thermomicrobiales bacterium]
MFETLVVALLPAVITVVLGFVAAKRHDFVAADASVLIKMVMHYALPLALFVGAVQTTRVSLLDDIPLLIGLLVAMVALYLVVLGVGRFGFRCSWGTSALAALAASAPNFAYIGTPVLGSLYGLASGIPIAVGNTLLVLTIFPATVVLLTLDAQSQAVGSQPGDGQGQGSRSGAAGVLSVLGHAFAQPIVWMPLLGVGFVMLGIRVPEAAANTLDLLGQSATGVALFSAGIVIAAYKVEVSRGALALAFLKNIGQPALLMAVLLALGYTNPLLGEAVVTTALPAIVSVALLGVQYGVAQSLTASTLFLSLVTSLGTLALFIVLTGA